MICKHCGAPIVEVDKYFAASGGNEWKHVDDVWYWFRCIEKGEGYLDTLAEPEKDVEELLDMDERELSDYIALTTKRRPELFDQPAVRPRKVEY